MIFNTFSYFLLFLIPASLVFRRVRTGSKPVILAVTGASFYLYFSLTAVGGIWGALCLAIFLWEAAISRLYRTGSRWCLAGILSALLVLLVFKYGNFLAGLLPAPLGGGWHWSGAFLPLGISFFTFEFIHYAIDRRRGTAGGETFWEYLAFILFFPTMVAGPIKRIQDFLPALRQPSVDGGRDWERGLSRILSGLAKKFVLADFLTTFSKHLNREDILAADRWVLPVWLLAFGFQIYLDFSAYSDIAIGSSRLFGLPVKENFDWPYLRGNLSGFWRHWHMSLTRWLTDYVYIPLGGSRKGEARIAVNLVVTFLVSGLWHGAGLNFLAWGLWHGFGLVVLRLWRSFRSAPDVPDESFHWAGWALTFVFVQAGWAFFIMDLPTALLFFRRCAGI